MIHSANIHDIAAAAVATKELVMASGSAATGFEVRSGVEAEPAHPEQRGADHGHRSAKRSHQVLAVAGPLADQQRADQTRDAGVDVHHGAAREVDRTLLEDPAGVALTSSSLACAAVLPPRHPLQREP